MLNLVYKVILFAEALLQHQQQKRCFYSTAKSLWEALSKSYKAETWLKYLETCFDLEICPKFLKFKAPNISVYKNINSVYNIGLKRKIKETRSLLKAAQHKYVNTKTDIFDKISFFQKQCLILLFNKHFKTFINNTLTAHRRKLYNLWREQRIRSPKCIVNLSNKRLSLQEEEVLRFGLDHHILPKKLNEIH